MFDVKRDSSKISWEKDSGGDGAVTSAIMISCCSCSGILEIKLRAGEDFHETRLNRNLLNREKLGTFGGRAMLPGLLPRALAVWKGFETLADKETSEPCFPIHN